MMENLLELREVRVCYGPQVALQISSLGVRPREILALMGPNGAGKSSLVRILGLLERPTQGEVYVRGRRVSYRPAELLSLRRRMATVFQEPLLCEGTVTENASLGLRLRGLSRREAEARVAPWLERLGIAPLAHRKARTLSGGESQRTSLARAFALDPEILLLDEPLAALDPPTRDALLHDLEAILREMATTTILVTHDRNEAMVLGDRVGVMLGGEIRQLGRPEEVFACPLDEEIARFVGVETLLPGKVVGWAEGLAAVSVEGVKILVCAEAQPGEKGVVCLRPEDVNLTRQKGPPSSARNHLKGRVVKVIPRGFQCRVILDCGFPLVALITQQSREELGLREGTEVFATFKATAAHLIRRVEGGK